ncbi:MAG: Arm DNA-binding domain-containing protein, partial [Mariprofundaceae bacterium]
MVQLTDKKTKTDNLSDGKKKKVIKSDKQVQAAFLPKGKKKEKYTVGDGLYLLVKEAGKYWKYGYRYDQKRKEASLGVYPLVSLKQAKAKVQYAKDLLTQGIDPNQHKKEAKQANIEKSKQQVVKIEADANTFEK